MESSRNNRFLFNLFHIARLNLILNVLFNKEKFLYNVIWWFLVAFLYSLYWWYRISNKRAIIDKMIPTPHKKNAPLTWSRPKLITPAFSRCRDIEMPNWIFELLCLAAVWNNLILWMFNVDAHGRVSRLNTCSSQYFWIPLSTTCSTNRSKTVLNGHVL